MFTWVGLSALGMPGAFGLAIIAGLLELIPNLGPVIAAIPAVIVALMQGSNYLPVSHLAFAGLVILFYVIVQQLENSLIVPRVLGEAVELPPLVILVGLLVGASIAGVLGTLLATPIIASGREILRYVYRKMQGDEPFPHIQLSTDFDLDRAARMTPGFSGADLENVMNEATLLAARRNASAVTMQDFEAAIERVVAGLEKRSRVMNEQERTTVAYHESGHALVAELVPYADPVAKVSIVPRGRGALGYTMQMPTEDRYLLTREELEDRIAVMLGGRAAEQVVRGAISTGASDDIQRATELARRMVAEFGMSDRLGAVRYATRQYQFLSGDTSVTASPETLKIIDEEVQRIIDQQYERAQQLLKDHRAALEYVAGQLLETETVDGAVVQQGLAMETPDGSLAWQALAEM